MTNKKTPDGWEESLKGQSGRGRDAPCNQGVEHCCPESHGKEFEFYSRYDGTSPGLSPSVIKRSLWQQS